MKKNITKFIAALLVLTLALGTLAGCGGKKKDKIVGTWEYRSDIIEIAENNTYVYYYSRGAFPGTWMKSGDNYIFTGGMTGASSYGIINKDGDLEILDDPGERDTVGDDIFTRK